ncbi:zinc-binding dehydrogenase [Paenibacillus tuaregi]|uniref:zinc-binding dehydrogenase n=1 Tax=Paenibacillus tuaregi TaxID=1816681 RepID=UPI0009EF6440|nr:zinc-binding dehydrogenase [Paenibacillus tuaregi]
MDSGVEEGLVNRARIIRSQRSAWRLKELADLYEQGRLKIHIRQVSPLERSADAYRAVELGHGRGKVVINVD